MPTSTDAPFRKALPWTAFVALLFMLNYTARSALSPLLVGLERDLAIGHAQATGLLLVQAAGFSASQFICGFLLARISPGRMVAVSITLSGLCLLCMSLVESLGAARLVFGLFGFMAGLYFPAGMATLSSLVNPRDWGKAVAVHELAPNTSFILLPLFAEAALRFMDWRGVFTILGGGLTLLGFAFALFGRGGRKLAAPPSYAGCREALLAPATWVFILLFSVCVAGEFATFSVLPVHLVTELHFTQTTANQLVSLSRLLCPLAAIAGGWFADRTGAGGIIKGYLILHGAALALMALHDPVWVFIGMSLQAFVTAFSFPALFKAFAQSFPAARQPLLLSLTMPVACLIGTGAAPAFLGLCGQHASFGTGFITLGVLSVLSLCALRALPDAALGRG